VAVVVAIAFKITLKQDVYSRIFGGGVILCRLGVVQLVEEGAGPSRVCLRSTLSETQTTV